MEFNAWKCTCTCWAHWRNTEKLWKCWKMSQKKPLNPRMMQEVSFHYDLSLFFNHSCIFGAQYQPKWMILRSTWSKKKLELDQCVQNLKALALFYKEKWNYQVSKATEKVLQLSQRFLQRKEWGDIRKPKNRDISRIFSPMGHGELWLGCRGVFKGCLLSFPEASRQSLETPPTF